MKTKQKLLSFLLAVVFVLGLLPAMAMATPAAEPEHITVYTRNSEDVWVAPPAGTVDSYSSAEVPSQYGTGYYTDARYMDIYLTGIEDDASFNIKMHTDISIDEDEFEIERFLSTIGYVKADASSATDLEDAIWDEVHEIYSETDDSYTFTVQLENGEATFVVYYYWSLYNLLYGGSSTPVALVLNFHKQVAAEPEHITVYTRNSEDVWVAPPAGTVDSYSSAEVPSQYGTGYYTDARYMDIYLTGVEDNASFNIKMHTDISIDEDEFEIERFLSTIGYVKADASSATDLEDAIWDEVHEIYSETDDSYTFTVQLENGEATLVVYYYWSLYNLLYGGSSTPVALVLNFHVGGETPPEPPQPPEKMLTKITPELGQLENENALYGIVGNQNATYLIVPVDESTVDVTLTFSGNDYDVSVNNVAQDNISANNTLLVTLNAAMPYYDMPVEEAANTIKVSKNDKEEVYTLWVVNQRFDDLPDAVVDYLCIGSQYTNNTYGIKPIRSLVGSNSTTGTNNACGPVSLGNFGGYITYYYEDAITNNPNNPYGVDFIVYGNCFEPSNTAAELGQVWVSENGIDWYALAGGIHYEDYADWNYEITYTNLGDLGTSWADSLGGNGSTEFFAYPDSSMYPWYTFADGDEESITLSGICFIPGDKTSNNATIYHNMLPRYAAFGYADVGRLGTYLPGEDTSEWGDWTLGPSSQASYDALARNIAGNPYAGTVTADGSILSIITDGMDLAWAVNELGQPVSFPNGVHYVKIVTASNINNDMTYEKSTEINMVRVAQANDAPVGKTAAPAAITVDGADVPLVDGTFVYDVTVDGPFKVAVDVPEGTNVYINNNCATYANFDGMPLHQIVRVIVQEGEKEPVIYILNLTETTGTPAAAATLTLDCNGGTTGGSGMPLAFINGSAVYTIKFDANMCGDPLPEPVNTNKNVTFGGWFMGQKLFTAIPDEVTDTTLTAVWTPTQVTPAANTITVSFRLIGSTKSTGDINLADGDYKGATYVTWIPTGTYTVNENATVADLFTQATNAAGIRSEGADKGYVSTIYAPAALGGYALSEFTNGPKSGWMYTKNGVHTNAINVETMQDGDEIIFHYVDDYAWEVEDWAQLGGSGWPQLSDGTVNYWDAWLAAEDVAPAAGGNGGAGAGSSTTTPAAEAEGGEVTVEAEVKDGEAKAEVSEEAVAEALKDADDTLTVKVESKDADSVEAALSADAVQAAAAADVDLHVDTEVGTVKVDSDTLGELAESGKDVAVSVTENEDGTITVDVTAGGETVDASVKVELPATEAGQVLVIVNEDGTETVVKKSLVEGDTVYAEIPAGATVKVVEKDASYGDVKPGDWFAEDVEFVTTHGLFEGTDKGFEPTETMTRGMLATVLYRLEDATATGTSSFEDLALDKYYTDPAIWAGETGIIEGDENGFDADKEVTREQIATILFRYANYLGLDTSARASLSGFPDGGDTATWAKDAMSWAVAVGIFEGSDTGLNPGGDATRAQVAAIFQRMVKLIVM